MLTAPSSQPDLAAISSPISQVTLLAALPPTNPPVLGGSCETRGEPLALRVVTLCVRRALDDSVGVGSCELPVLHILGIPWFISALGK